MKRPAFQFYPGDWMRDTALRSCSVGARGLWIDMLCLMHEGYPYGYLKVGSKVILPPNLAAMVGATLQDVEGWLSELSTAGVFSTENGGAMFSRRMVRDEKTRQARAAGGLMGGNPALLGAKKVGSKVNLPPNLQPTPSSSSPSSTAKKKDPTQDATESSMELLRILGSALYKREPDQWPTDPEQRSALDVLNRPNWRAEVASVLAFNKKLRPEDRRFQMPQTLSRLLTDWNDTLDKARTYQPLDANGQPRKRPPKSHVDAIWIESEWRWQ